MKDRVNLGTFGKLQTVSDWSYSRRDLKWTKVPCRQLL